VPASEHVPIAVGEDGQPEPVRLDCCERFDHLGKRIESLDARYQVAHLPIGVFDARALQGVLRGFVPDLPVRRVLTLQEGVDHRVLEVRPASPGHEARRRVVRVALRGEVGSDRPCQPALHVDHGAVEVEHQRSDSVQHAGLAH